MIRFLPGVVGALAAYFAVLFTGWLQTGWLHAFIFFAVYLFVAVAVDRAMKQYGAGDRSRRV
ncbi:MAG: hypothetical protein ACREQZ_11855 [Woeseiaceae bacterium]